MVAPLLTIQAPAGQPVPNGLLAAALPPQDRADGHWGLGVQYQPDFCGPALLSEGACQPYDGGGISVSVNNARQATITVSGNPAGSYDIDWGDGNSDEDDTTPTGNTNTYAADGTYTVTMTGPDGYIAQVHVTVTNGVTSGPFAADATHNHVPTEGIDVVDALPFEVYHLLQCTAMNDEMEARARRALETGEGRAVEQAAETMFAASDLAVDLTPTPGTAVHPVDALGILEAYAGGSYGSLPLFHAPLRTATTLHALRGIKDGTRRLETGLGRPFAAGAGYGSTIGPGDATAGAGEEWLWVTGQLQILRSTTVDVQTQLDLATPSNLMLSRAARSYVLTVECIVGAVLVDPAYTVPAA